LNKLKENTFLARTRRYELAGGIILLVIENRANPTVSLSASLRAGSYFNPPERHGISSFTASMLSKGTANRSKLEIAGELETMGARRGYAANTFSVSIGAQCLSRDFDKVLGTIAEESQQPGFPVEELEKLRQQAIAAIKQEQEETRARAMERLSQLIYPPENPFYHLPAEQLISDVESITTDDLKRFYSERYSPASLIVAVVGDVDAGRVRDSIDGLFGGWKGSPKPAIDLAFTPLPETRSRELVAMKDKPNVDVVIGHPSRLRRANPDYLAAMLANRALGQSTLSSRLGLKIRDEMGLTYGINSSFVDTGLGDGPFVIGVTVAPQNIEPAINTTFDIVNEFREIGIRDDELRDERSSWIGSYKVGLATNSGMAAQLLAAEVHQLGVGYLDEFPNRIAAITKGEVDAAIKHYFHPERATTVVAGTVD